MKKYFTPFILMLCFLLSAFSVLAQPANDECLGAISINQSGTCVNTAGTTVGATLSMAATPCFGDPDDDVWFSFVATATDATVTISGAVAVTGTSTDTYFQVLSGSCGAQTSLICNDPNTGNVGGLVVGQTYYIRVYTYFNTSRVTFNICVTPVLTAPTSCPTLSAPTAGAQVSTMPTLTWSSVTNAVAYDIYLGTTNPPTVLYATVFNTTSYTVTPVLAPGTYYWYVVARNSAGAFTNCSANSRAFTVVAAPANDDCTGAISITTQANNATCTSNTAANTSGALGSVITEANCITTSDNDDIFYTFTATGTSQVLRFSGMVATSGTATTLGYHIFTGNCAGLTQLTSCNTGFGSTGAGAATISGLTSGTVYYLQLFTGGTNNSATFNFCLQDVIPPPANDECAGAIPMPVTTFGAACSNTAVTTAGATMSTVTNQANTCTSTGIDDDVFYTFTSTIAGAYTFSYTGLTAITGTASTVGMNVYTGSCGALTEVTSGCSSGFTTSRTVVLAAATQYTLRLYVGSSPNTGSFNFCITTPQTPPANDDCLNATTVMVNTNMTCTMTSSGTTAAATQSLPGCVGTADDDVWYSFVATSSNQKIKISNVVAVSGSSVDIVHQIFSGTCAGLTSLYCTDTPDSTIATGLIPGNTYFIRVYTYFSSDRVTFDVCVSNLPAPPANDECAGAIGISTQPFNNTCAASTSANTTNATPSFITETNCSTTGDNDDIFYSFTATATSQILRFSNMVATQGTATTLGYQVFSACTAASQLISCSTGFGSAGSGAATISGLTIGTVYNLRLFTGSTGNSATFDFCLQDAPPAPANDNCAGAIAITTQAFGAPCSSSTSATTVGSNPSTITEVTNCVTTNDDDDIFYTFIATQTSQVLRFSNMVATGTATTLGYHVFATCASTTPLTSCSSSFGSGGSGTTTITGLAIGTQYVLQLFTGTTAGTASFDFCLQDLPPVPSNDECASAITVMTQPFNASCTTPTAATTNGATASAITEINCSTSNDNDDVFYKFTATATSQVLNFSNMVAGTGTATTLGYQIFTACTAASQLTSCSTGFGTTGAGTTTITGLTIGTVYNLRLFTGSTANSANFNFCIQDPPPPPSNDNCAGAGSLNGGLPVNGTTVGASQSMAPEACATLTPAQSVDVFYQITATQNGTVTVALTNPSTGFDPVIQAYSGSCGGLTNIGCADAGASNANETLTLTGLTAGQTYFFRVYSYNTTNGSFSLLASGGAVALSVEYFKGNKQAKGNYLEWKVNCSGSSSATMELQRSNDGINFKAVHALTATALRCLEPFNFTDLSPLVGTNFYRIKTIDADGKISFSSIIALLNKNAGFEFVSLSPNPVSTVSMLNITSAKDNLMEVRLTDVVGRILQKRSVRLTSGINNVKFNFEKLSPGIYYLAGNSSDGENRTLKFIKD